MQTAAATPTAAPAGYSVWVSPLPRPGTTSGPAAGRRKRVGRFDGLAAAERCVRDGASPGVWAVVSGPAYRPGLVVSTLRRA